MISAPGMLTLKATAGSPSWQSSISPEAIANLSNLFDLSSSRENAAKTQLLANGPDQDDRERLRRRIYVHRACGTIFSRTNDTS